MTSCCQCVVCGEFLTMVANQIYAGWYRCPCCTDIGLLVPETELTPRGLDPLDICVEFEVVGSNRKG